MMAKAKKAVRKKKAEPQQQVPVYPRIFYGSGQAVMRPVKRKER
jgi:hypothetical protein